MHDILHDLATSTSNYKTLDLKGKSRCFVRTPNHQHHPSVEEIQKGAARSVRSVISRDVGDVSHMFCIFKSLRSLDISDADLKELPSVIGRLKHLRYIDISGNRDLKVIPESITKLYNLQTLRMMRCFGIRMLPIDMVNLVRLRHIHFEKYWYLRIYNVGRLTELRTLSCFQVIPEEGFRITELKGLNKLRGELRIDDLNNVRDREEAEEASLKDKDLSELELCNCNDENVLEGLVPPSSIKRLQIHKYNGVKFPSWMSVRINNSKHQLTQLVDLRLLLCINCEIMPSLGNLPHLQCLHVLLLYKITSIGREFYGECNIGVTLFPKLKTFSLQSMRSLVQWDAVVASEGGEITSVEVFPSLEKLSIGRCPRLRSIPLRHLSSLARVTIESCDDMEFLSNDFQSLPSLDYLEIKKCRNLTSLSSVQELKSAKRLLIQRCVRLTSLPNVECHNTLEDLCISHCPKVTGVPHWIKLCTSLKELTLSYLGLISFDDNIIDSLAQLKKLTLGPFSEELENFPGLNLIHHLAQSIEKLTILGWEKLKSLPHQLQYLTGLRNLAVHGFKTVETCPDWLGSLSSLQVLHFYYCDNLKSLPTSMERLSNLTSLIIYDCPFLKERYNQDTGLDRHQISHIAYISVF